MDNPGLFIKSSRAKRPVGLYEIPITWVKNSPCSNNQYRDQTTTEFENFENKKSLMEDT